jgi:hypothetical protein
VVARIGWNRAAFIWWVRREITVIPPSQVIWNLERHFLAWAGEISFSLLKIQDLQIYRIKSI